MLLESSIADFHAAAPPDAAVFPQWMGVPLSIMILLGIAFAYRSQGTIGLSVLMAYITGLITVQLTMKQVLHSFPYPLFMSTMHFLVTVAAVQVAVKITGEKHPEVEVNCPKFRKWFLRNIVPPVICQYLSIALNNMSLLYIGAGINAMIGLATPVITALVAAVFGMKIAALAWFGILLTVGGDAVITVDGFSISAAGGESVSLFITGVMLSVGAMGARGAKTVFQDKLMNTYGEDDENKKFTPLQAWCLQGPLLIAFGFAGTVVKEGFAPWNALPAALSSPALLPIVSSIACAVLLNISAMQCVQMLGAPAAQIAGKLNVLIVASLSCAFLGETLTLKQGACSLLILSGAALYQKAQKGKINNIKGLVAHFKGEKYDATDKC